MEKIFAIGDIHGCYDKLRSLMDRIPIDLERDTLVMMGDYIDRGPQSFEVVEYAIELKGRCKHAVFLKGNHELMLENYLNGADRLMYLANGGRQTLENYMQHRPGADAELIPRAHLDFFDSLVPYYESEDYIFVHAGLRQNVPLADQSLDDLLWIRSAFVSSDHAFEKRVVFGHTAMPKPLVAAHKIGIDTGAVYGNKLTCVELPEVVFYQV